MVSFLFWKERVEGEERNLLTGGNEDDELKGPNYIHDENEQKETKRNRRSVTKEQIDPGRKSGNSVKVSRQSKAGRSEKQESRQQLRAMQAR